MREPDLERDGWCLDDGEERHREAPVTFWIPDASKREQLQPGDYAKLIFCIAVDDGGATLSVERMWVLVRERTPGGYLGVLDNDPDAIEENEELWSGIELPFSVRHVIDIQARTNLSTELAAQEPTRRWSRE